MNREFDTYHGLAFCRLIHFGKKVSVNLYSSKSNSSYVINGSTGIFIKHSAKRLSPWRFSFLKEHQDEIRKMNSELDEVFVLLVCGTDGIVCLSYSELKNILDENHEDIEWVSASRKKREQYVVEGTDGRLRFRIGPGEYPKKIFLTKQEGNYE